MPIPFPQIPATLRRLPGRFIGVARFQAIASAMVNGHPFCLPAFPHLSLFLRAFAAVLLTSAGA